MRSTEEESGSAVAPPASRVAPTRLRALAQAVGVMPTPPHGAFYHAFISYSHAADGRLAPALQAALQRFARPWYQTRALHIFRDDAALSTSSDLWHSVRDALDASEYYILLASPAAAQSEWVTKEADYWRANKSIQTILIGLTDGKLPFGAAAHEIATRDVALPPPLVDAFAEEPRYTDLRWVRSRDQLADSDPRFLDAVADLAATLHGKSKDELTGDAVREQRRRVRVIRGAVSTLTILLVLAAVLAVVALTQYSHAVRERDVATSRALAAESVNAQTADPQLALLLALRAYDASPSSQAESAVRSGLEASAVRGWLAPVPDDLPAGEQTAPATAFNAAGDLAAVSQDRTVEIWRWRSRAGPGSSAHPYTLSAPVPVTSVAFAAGHDAVLFTGSNGEVYAWDWMSGTGAVERLGGLRDPLLSPDGLHVASVSGGDILIGPVGGGAKRMLLRVPCCVAAGPRSRIAMGFSANGDYLAVLSGRAGVVVGSDTAGSSVSLFDTTGALVASRALPAGASAPVAPSDNGATVGVADGAAVDEIDVADPAARPVVHEIVSPPGLAAHCCDVDEPVALAFNPAGTVLAVGTGDPWVRVWAGNSQSPIYLNSSTGSAAATVFSGDGSDLLTSGGPSQVWAWNASTTLSLDLGSRVTAAAVTPDGQTFALATADDRIVLWNIPRNTVTTLTGGAADGITRDQSRSGGSDGPHGDIYLLAFSPSGRYLVAAGTDDVLRTWDLADDIQERQQVLPGAPADLAFAPDGRQLLASYAGGVLREPVGAGSPTAEARLAGGPNSARILRFDDDGAAELVEADSVGDGRLARWNGQVGSPPQTVATVPLPGSPLARSELLSGGRIFLTDGQSSELLVPRGNRFVARTPRFLDGFYGCSLDADGRTLFGTYLGGELLAWNLHPKTPPQSFATGTEAAPTCLGTPDGSRVLAYQSGTNSPVLLYPSAQAASFPDVLRLARSRVVRRLTRSERHTYLGP